MNKLWHVFFTGAGYSPDGYQWRRVENFVGAGLITACLTAYLTWLTLAHPEKVAVHAVVAWSFILGFGLLALFCISTKRELMFDRRELYWKLIETTWFLFRKQQEGTLKPPFKLRYQQLNWSSMSFRDHGSTADHRLFLVTPQGEILAGQYGKGLDPGHVTKLAAWMNVELILDH